MKAIASGVLALVMVVLVCVNSAQAGATPVHPFKGTWTGQWRNNQNEHGAATFHVTGNGTLTGTVEIGEGETVTVSGRLGRAGVLTVSYSGGDSGTADGTMRKVVGNPNRMRGVVHIHSDTDGDFNNTFTLNRTSLTP